MTSEEKSPGPDQTGKTTATDPTLSGEQKSMDLIIRAEALSQGHIFDS